MLRSRSHDVRHGDQMRRRPRWAPGEWQQWSLDHPVLSGLLYAAMAATPASFAWGTSDVIVIVSLVLSVVVFVVWLLAGAQLVAWNATLSLTTRRFIWTAAIVLAVVAGFLTGALMVMRSTDQMGTASQWFVVR